MKHAFSLPTLVGNVLGVTAGIVPRQANGGSTQCCFHIAVVPNPTFNSVVNSTGWLGFLYDDIATGPDVAAEEWCYEVGLLVYASLPHAPLILVPRIATSELNLSLAMSIFLPVRSFRCVRDVYLDLKQAADSDCTAPVQSDQWYLLCGRPYRPHYCWRQHSRAELLLERLT